MLARPDPDDRKIIPHPAESVRVGMSWRSHESTMLAREERRSRRHRSGPAIEDPRDAIINITTTCICGSDLHLYDGYVPTMEAGDVLGHEPMGEVVEIGKDVKKLKKGDRVVVPFTISCGECWYCKRTEFSLCDTSNPNADIARKAMGQSPAGPLRLLAHAGWLSRWTGRVPASALCRCRPGW